MPSSASLGSGRERGGFWVPYGPVHLGLPLSLSFCREMQKGIGKEREKAT